MEYYSKNENKNFLSNSSLYPKNKNFDYSINDLHINNNNNINISDIIKENNNESISLANKSLFFTFSNMFRYMNYSKPMSTRINPVLIDFNKELSNNNNQKKENEPKLKNTDCKINKNNYAPLKNWNQWMIKDLRKVDSSNLSKILIAIN